MSGSLKIRSFRCLLLSVLVSVAGTGCTLEEQRRGSWGAAGGAIVGSMLGNRKSAAAGAVIGALVGAATAPAPNYQRPSYRSVPSSAYRY